MKEDDNSYDGVSKRIYKMIADEIILNKKYFEKLSIK